MNKTLSVFIICFITPVVAALLALKFDWLTPAQTNHGQFVVGEKHIANWPEQTGIKWSLVTFDSDACNLHCKQNKDLIKNVYDVLGKHNLYVGTFAMSTQQATTRLTNLISQEIKLLENDNKHLEINKDALYLVDHRGLVVLRYPVAYSQQADTQMKKGLIKDLKKLLNYSRSRA